jgi:hypothetical protein
MENAIPALILGAILIVASSLMARGSIQSYDRLGQSIKATETLVGERVQTRLAITDVVLDPAKDTLTLNLRNDGQTRIALYDRVDVIVTYVTNAGAVAHTWLAYAAGSPGANNWSITSIADDAFEPGLLNTGETAQLQVELGTPAGAGFTNRIVIASEAGAVTSAPFSS